VVGLGAGHTAARAATVTSTLPASVRDYLWSNPSLWSNTPAAATYPNNGNLGNTYNVVLTGGSVDRDVNVIVNDLTIQGTDLGVASSGSSSLAVMGVLRMRNAFLRGLVTVPAGARVEFARTELEPRNYIYGTFNLGGSASFATDVAGDFRIDPSGGSINIQSTGTLTVNRPLLLLPPNGGLETGGPATVVNAGLIDQQAGQRMSWYRQWPVLNSGTIRVNADFGGDLNPFQNTGLLDLQSAGAVAKLYGGYNSGTMSGQVRLAAGANLTLGGSYAVRNLSVTNAGTIHLTGAATIATPTTLPGAVNIATNTARLTLSADLALTGPAALDGGALIQGSATTGTTRVTASDLTFGGATVNNAVLAVPTGGTLRLAGAANHFLENATLVVNGAADWSGGAIVPSSGTARVQVAAGGSMSVAAGATASLSARLENAGLVDVGRGGKLLGGNTWVNTGAVRVTGGVVQTGSGLDPFAGNSGAFDLRDGGGLDYLGSIATVADRVRAGYHGGAWDGPGIRSSAAQTDRTTAVGYAAGPNAPGTFMGLSVGPGHTLVRHTKYGDATLDGVVNFDDLLALAKNYNAAGTHWYQGDFDYSGRVNFDDLLILAKNYNAAMPAAGAVPGATADFAADVAAAFAAAVPEPSGALGGAACAIALAARRRRQHANP
jgi:hypothetical protein